MAGELTPAIVYKFIILYTTCLSIKIINLIVNTENLRLFIQNNELFCFHNLTCISI